MPALLQSRCTAPNWSKANSASVCTAIGVGHVDRTRHRRPVGRARLPPPLPGPRSRRPPRPSCPPTAACPGQRPRRCPLPPPVITATLPSSSCNMRPPRSVAAVCPIARVRRTEVEGNSLAAPSPRRPDLGHDDGDGAPCPGAGGGTSSMIGGPPAWWRWPTSEPVTSCSTWARAVVCSRRTCCAPACESSPSSCTIGRVAQLRERFADCDVTVVRADASELRLPAAVQGRRQPAVRGDDRAAATVDRTVEPARSRQLVLPTWAAAAVGGGTRRRTAERLRVLARPASPAARVPAAASPGRPRPGRESASTVALNQARVRGKHPRTPDLVPPSNAPTATKAPRSRHAFPRAGLGPARYDRGAVKSLPR